jgi:cyclase
MLQPRIIPCLLVKNGGLVKTVGFGAPKYVGDPLNAVRIFNEKEVDELTVLDIDATAQGREPNYALIRDLAVECRMPLCYGGGVTSEEQIQRIVALGVEKVAVSAAAVADPELLRRGAAPRGGGSLGVVAAVRKVGSRAELFTHNGSRATGLDPAAFAARAERLGAGEIVVNSIDRDGAMKGYDVELLARVREATTLPMTALGGAGSLKDIGELIARFGIVGAAAGSLFVFKGIYRAVLINYPNRSEKDALITAARGRAAAPA